MRRSRDQFFRGAIGLGHQIHIALIFGGDAALEVAADQGARLERDRNRTRDDLHFFGDPVVDRNCAHWLSSESEPASLRGLRRPSRPCSVIVLI